MNRSLYHPLQLPGLELPGNLFLAPLAGYTDRAFRGICLRYGADLTYTEMVSCEGIVRKNKKTAALMERGAAEPLLAIQIFTGSPETAAASVEEVLPYSPTLIDLNCGCPVPKVNKSGSGADLMKDPVRLGEIVRALVETLEKTGRTVPVTVKIRSGWDDSSRNFIQAARSAVEAGAAMVTLHPRTRKQGYAGKADWEEIRRLKEALPVPVIGSGDLYTPEDARSMMETTGCDGVMFARGALGNPAIFRDTKRFLAGEDSAEGLDPETLRHRRSLEKLDIAREHLELSVETLGSLRAGKEMKKHLCAYSRGITGGAELRNQVVQVKKAEEYFAYIDAFRSRLV